MAHQSVRVALGERGYDVVVAEGFAGAGEAIAHATGARRVVLVTDDVVGPLWLGRVAAELAALGIVHEALVVSAGEARKDHETWWRIVDGLLRAGIDRRTPVLALGGGVVGDLVGFAAATVLRGVPFVQLPTTVLAMVDSSVGGKTGFNHPLGKNLVGAFHQPSLVWAALEALDTLDPRERRAGLGEVVKTAAIADGGWFDQVASDAAALARGEVGATARAVAASVACKARIVAEDERETGRRAILNAGHTVGHALEAVLGYGTLLHGEAVGVGLVAEARWSEREGRSLGGTADRLAAVLDAMGLPHAQPSADRVALAAAAGLDKKAYGNRLTLPIIPEIGHCRLIQLERARIPELFLA